jgi:hypothetical protein
VKIGFKQLDANFPHHSTARIGVLTASDQSCLTGIMVMRSTKSSLPVLVNDPELKELQEQLKEPFAAIERALLPNDRPLTPAELHFLRTPIGVEPK